MSDSTIDLVNDYEGETSFISIMGTSHDSHIPHFIRNHLEPKLIPLSDDSDSQIIYGDSL